LEDKSNFAVLFDFNMLFTLFGKQNRNAWKGLKYVAGEWWRSTAPIV
jgi:hypothetical protein